MFSRNPMSLKLFVHNNSVTFSPCAKHGHIWTEAFTDTWTDPWWTDPPTVWKMVRSFKFQDYREPHSGQQHHRLRSASSDKTNCRYLCEESGLLKSNISHPPDRESIPDEHYFLNRFVLLALKHAFHEKYICLPAPRLLKVESWIYCRR